MPQAVKFEEPVVTEYVCSNEECDAVDHDRGVNLPAPLALTCAACGNGRNLDVQQMLMTKRGMFPALPESD